MNHLKLILGLTPVTCVVIYIVQWFVLGTMEHGLHNKGQCDYVLLHMAQIAGYLVLAILFFATVVLGIQEAGKAWGKIRS